MTLAYDILIRDARTKGQQIVEHAIHQALPAGWFCTLAPGFDVYVTGEGGQVPPSHWPPKLLEAVRLAATHRRTFGDYSFHIQGR